MQQRGCTRCWRTKPLSRVLRKTMSMLVIKLTNLGLVIGFLFQVLISGQVYGASDAARPEAAKLEGKVVWWTTVPIDQSKVLADQFQKQFPSIEVDLFRTGATSLQNKIVTEARVGRHSLGYHQLQRRIRVWSS